MYDDKGPFVAVAALCETVVEAKDGTLTLVRLIDQVAINLAGPEPPAMLPRGTIGVTLVIALKAGAARGRSVLKVGLERPDGQTILVQPLDVTLGGGSSGMNFVLPTQIEVEHEGLYWFNVTIEAPSAPAGVAPQLLTRIPLVVKYSRTQTSG